MKRPYRLLIVEDEKETLDSLCRFFRKNRYEVTGVDNGLDGIKLLDQHQQNFDLVITDLVMPNISGVAVISIAKKRHPEMPVIAITGWGEHPESLASEAQADLILSKPIELPELNTLLKDLLAKQKTA